MLVALSINYYLSYDGSVCSAPGYQSVDSGFESPFTEFFWKGGKYPGG